MGRLFWELFQFHSTLNDIVAPVSSQRDETQGMSPSVIVMIYINQVPNMYKQSPQTFQNISYTKKKNLYVSRRKSTFHKVKCT